jgi:hypothetical protein
MVWARRPVSSASRAARGAVVGFVAASLVSAVAQGALPAGDRPLTYALVAAVGEELATVTEVSSTGTHLSPIRRTSVTVENDQLNRFVLHSLDTAIAKLDPDSRRVYMTLRPDSIKGVAAPKRERATLDRVVAALERMPQRSEWDRIVVVTPTYAAKELDGLPRKLQGPGVFVQPMCQGRTAMSPTDPDSCATNTRPPAGPEAVAPDDTVLRINYYAAPFSYVQVWVLDPRTLAVIDQQKVFDSKKLYDPNNGPIGLPKADFLAARFAAVIEASVRRAVDDTVLRGKVETGPVREVPIGGPEH